MCPTSREQRPRDTPCGQPWGRSPERCGRSHSPQAPTHILVVPKKPISKLSDASEEDQHLLGHLLLVASKITKEKNIEHYRLVINNGSDAGQTVYHVHIHILAGRNFGWPPG